MTKPTFRQYLTAQKDRDDPIGDLARDFLLDPRAKGLSSVESIEQQIRGVASASAQNSLDEALAEYRQTER